MKPITKVKKWILDEIQGILECTTCPQLKELNEENLDKAIKQNTRCGSPGEFAALKKAKEIYMIVKNW